MRTLSPSTSSSLVALFVAACSGWLTSACRVTNAAHLAAESAAVTPEGPAAAIADGRYVGYATPSKLGERLPMTLDLVRVATLGPTVHYRAVMRLAVGGLASTEYGSAYFTDVAYDGKTLAFTDGPANIRLSQVSSSGPMLKGQIDSVKDEGNASFTLVREGTVDPALAAGPVKPLPIAPIVSGRYAGFCGGHVASLELELSKWHGTAAGDGTLFGSYRIAGRFGQTDPVVCAGQEICLKETITGGNFNAFTGKLALTGPTSKHACQLQGATLTCDGCALTRDPISPHAIFDTASDHHSYPRQEHLPAVAVTPAAQPSRAGQYYGFLHHENRDVYQLVALNVTATPSTALQGPPEPTAAPKEVAGPEATTPTAADPEATSTMNQSTPRTEGSVVPKTPAKEMITAVATLYFGEGDSSEFIAYRLGTAAFPPVDGSAFVLDGPGETFLVVDSWDAQGLKGVWYSKTFGRVGTVELQKDVVPPLSGAALVMGQVGGSYQNDSWDFDVATAANISESAGEFYPIKVYGSAREKLADSRRRTITEGAFDFYADALAFRLDDGRIASGRLTLGGLQLYWPPKPRLGTPLASGAIQLFNRIPDGEKTASSDYP